MAVSDNFTMPVAVKTKEGTATANYACFIAEPWEKGFGHTLGNALRRVLLSSLRGVAVSSLRIDGVPHEFGSVDDVVEDVTEIVLNVKQLRLRCEAELPRTLQLYADKAGAVTAANIQTDGVTEIVNPDLHICTIDKKRTLHMEIEICDGRGYRPAEENKREDQPIGVIPVDSIFSPVERVRYDVLPCRVGNRTDYDSLELEVWTDGRVAPKTALLEAAALLREHLAVFVEEAPENAVEAKGMTQDDWELVEKLAMPVNDMELSVRAKNCLDSANVMVVGDLVEIPGTELLKYRNFGKKSLENIKKFLGEMGLTLGAPLKDEVKAALRDKIEAEAEEGSEEEKEEAAAEEE